ncbi:MAG: PEP-utilizing enzyme [Polyangia bacterium]
MLALRDCVGDRAAAAGRKACRLGEALRRGLRVPDGFVVLPDEPLPTPAQLEAALVALVPAPSAGAGPGVAPPGPGARFAVRSSAALEDQADRSAAGLFCSRVDVAAADVAAALAAVRESGQSEAVRAYAGGPVKVAVLVQPMVAAERLGVLLLDDDNDEGAKAVCEERAPGTPEWGEVTVRSLGPARDAGLDAELDAEILKGARALAAQLAAELGRSGPTLIEYARGGPGAAVTFLQVRPAPRAPEDRAVAAWAGAVPPPLAAHELVFDRDHNPDPLSAAQAGLVERLSPEPAAGGDGGDGGPGLVQAVVRGYLYYALPVSAAGAMGAAGPAGLPLAALAERFRGEIAPAWEAVLQPLEAKLAAADGALRPELQAWRAASLSPTDGRAPVPPELPPELLDELLSEVSLDAALGAYAAVFRRYVGELSPSLRRARAHLDQLLRANLGEPLARHGELVAALGGVQLERLQALWELGRAGAEADALRRYLAHHGAWAPAWDVACACDDERPEPVRQQALRLGSDPRSPRERHEAAQGPFHAAVQALLERLPRMARGALKALLPQVRAALVIAEEDDALFSRAQRLVRWALLLRGAALVRRGRLRAADDVFELPLSLHEPASPRSSLPSRPFDAAAFAPGADLLQMAAQAAAARQAARALVPPLRLVRGRPHFELAAPPAGAAVLRGFGVAAGGPVRGRARVVRSLDEAAALAAHAADLGEDEILVLPALLPAWAPSLFRARALVTDSGGALGHGALLAREAGVPAVLGTRVATRRIAPGQALWVDGAAGLVCLL